MMSRMLTPGHIQYVVLGFILTVLSSCSSSTAGINYYLIEPVRQQVDHSARPELAIRLLDIQLPQYMERFQIAGRSATNRLYFSDSHQWGENLRKNLLRTMSSNLQYRLGTLNISSPVSRMAVKPDYSVEVFIDRFERGADGYVTLTARWQILDGKTGHSLLVDTTDLVSESGAAADAYGMQAEIMSQLFAALCTDIAKQLLVVEATE
ncbi:MAG: membrane integrity-associated transporter subunit PqiC [Pseudomonadales bacterium]|nr:membrane integrity-associated transporter subunit PqiC [Pseudomonadales bacterium]